jgi:hypothetical protein
VHETKNNNNSNSNSNLNLLHDIIDDDDALRDIDEIQTATNNISNTISTIDNAANFVINKNNRVSNINKEKTEEKNVNFQTKNINYNNNAFNKQKRKAASNYCEYGGEYDKFKFERLCTEKHHFNKTFYNNEFNELHLLPALLERNKVFYIFILFTMFCLSQN